MVNQLRHIAHELGEHAPFAALGALFGLVVMGIIHLTKLAPAVSYYFFHILHPAHLLLSSAVTATMFRRHGGGILASTVIGIAGAIAICTISDVALPYLGGAWIGALMTLHLDIVEKPWLVFLPALVGAAIGALMLRWTRCPHAAHISISTLASLFYLRAFGVVDWLPLFPLVFVVLSMAVWIPCCTSDIVFPLLFVRETKHRKG